MEKKPEFQEAPASISEEINEQLRIAGRPERLALPRRRLGFIYLASPYSHHLNSIRESRYGAAMLACVQMHEAGIPVFSPIVHWHPLTELLGLPNNNAAFIEQNSAMIDACSEAWLLLIPGWRESEGIAWEREYCYSAGKMMLPVLPDQISIVCQEWLRAQS